MTRPAISVVMPVRNEERHLQAAVERVLAQDYDGELELVLSIAPSEDATHEVAERLASLDPRITVVDNPSGHTPAGLNVAIAHARHDILVRVDGHGELSDGYLETVVDLLDRTGAANVGGLMDARGTTPLERAIAAAYNSRVGLGGGGFHLATTPEGPAETVFLGAFRRAPLEAVGGYDETLHRAQDWELNYRLRKAGHLVWFSPDLRVVYRPRSSLAELAHQFWRTGQWRRELMGRHVDTARFRYLVPPVAVVGLGVGVTGGAVGLALRNRALTGLLAAPLGYTAFLVAAAVAMRGLDPAARLRLPVVLAVMHVAWGAGFLRGVPRES